MKEKYLLLVLIVMTTLTSAELFGYGRTIGRDGLVNITINNNYNNFSFNGSTLYLNNISDVNTPSPLDGQALVWDNSAMKWVAKFIISRWNIDISNGYLFNDTDTLYFNDTKLNSTVTQLINSSKDNTYDIYFNTSKKSIVIYNLTDADASIITVNTVPGQKIIYGGNFE